MFAITRFLEPSSALPAAVTRFDGEVFDRHRLQPSSSDADAESTTAFCCYWLSCVFRRFLAGVVVIVQRKWGPKHMTSVTISKNLFCGQSEIRLIRKILAAMAGPMEYSVSQSGALVPVALFPLCWSPVLPLSFGAHVDFAAASLTSREQKPGHPELASRCHRY